MISELARRVARYLWTAVHLKPVQVWGRLVWTARRRFRRISGLPEIALDAARILDLRGKPPKAHVTFRFLSERREYPADAVPWDLERSNGLGNGVPVKLWRYNLQYFDWLNHGEIADDVGMASFLVLDWIARCPDDRTEAWEPYPVSRRIASWLKWLRRTDAGADAGFMTLIRRSMLAQVRRLELDLEIHIQGNHLLMNRMALVSAIAWLIATSPNGAAGLHRRFVTHANGLKKEIAAQILPDGGHEERSPMYHREMLEGISETAETVRRFVAGAACDEVSSACGSLLDACDAVLPKMRGWLDLLTHPDGRIALFHDAALSVGMQINTIEYRQPSATWLPDSGYFTVRQPGGMYLVVCAHGPSPSHQPGHSHCDIGSYELSVRGRRLIVDSGTGSYQNSDVRRLCRSTGAHNVPMVEGREQSDMWGDFRVGRRARVTKTEHRENEFTLQWQDMNGDVFLRRMRWNTSSITVRDIRQTENAHGRAVSLVHLAPDMVSTPGEGHIRIEADGGTFCTILSRCGMAVEPSVYYPEFGPGHENFCLRLTAEGEADIEYVITW